MSGKTNRPARGNGGAAATKGYGGQSQYSLTIPHLQVFARQLHGWGASVTAIKLGTKRPAHKWQQWQAERQTRAELDALPWHAAAAVGVVNGSGDFRVFDIDAVKDGDGAPVGPVPESVVIELLIALGLPDDYQWSYRSGSGAGWGVVIRCAEALPDGLPAGAGVIIGAPADGRNFGQLELRWSSGQTVIDGAHPTGPGYQWRLGQRPFVPPALLTAVQVSAAFTTIAELAPPAQIPTPTPAPSPNGHAAGVTSATEKYAAAALADAIRQVATATPGDRNKALFRQTAALAELVNGGALARPDVERAMTGAALGAGLTAGEAAATVASAFTHVGTTARTPAPSANGHGATAGASGQPARLDDTANAERFVTQHGNDVRYDHSGRQWYIWTGTHWRRDDDGGIQRLAKMTARAIYEEAAAAAKAGLDGAAAELSKWARHSAAEPRRNAMLNLARAEKPIAVTHDCFNRHDLLVNVQNGTIDLATGQQYPHDRGDLLTYVLPVDYDPAAVCPTWIHFLWRITNDDDDLVSFLARAVAYTLTGQTAEQCLFFLYGRGANGKSTFIETVMTLMGDLGHKARAQILMQDEHGRVPNEVAALAGKRLVVASELADGGRLNEGLIKDLTGGDTMSARFLYGEPFTFKPTFKLWLYGNHKPPIHGTDDGIWRRVRLIPFEVQIPEGERDTTLPAKLRAELPGILSWALRGWQDYQQDGLPTPAAVRAATASYRSESDVLGKFLDDRCDLADGMTAEAGKLYTAYTEWATENGVRAQSNVRFAKALTERGFTKEKNPSTKRQEYQGVGIV